MPINHRKFAAVLLVAHASTGSLLPLFRSI